MKNQTVNKKHKCEHFKLKMSDCKLESTIENLKKYFTFEKKKLHISNIKKIWK